MTGYIPRTEPAPLLAEHARILREQHSGPCALCGWALLRGERAADLPGGRGLAHVSCIVAASPR